MNDTLTVTQVPMNKLFEDTEFNCRGEFSAMEVVDLAKSIEQDGLLQPIVVTPIDHDEFDFKIVAGFRRFNAHKVLKRDVIDCIVKEGIDDATARIMNLTENLNRKSLNIVQEAKALIPLMKQGMNEPAIIKALPGVSRGWVQVRGYLLQLPAEIQQEAVLGTITQANIRDLYTLQKNKHITTEMLFAEVIKLKDSKAKGQEGRVSAAHKKKDKRIRSKREMQEMITHLLYQLNDTTFASRSLAWACGNLESLEFLADLKIECNKIGKDYDVPEHW